MNQEVEFKKRRINIVEGGLFLQGLGITDLDEIKGLDKLQKLEGLYLHGNKIKEIKGLENLVNLKSLILHYNQISEIKGLDTLINLEVLNLLGNKITQIKGLDNLKNLKILNLSQNLISEVKGLSNLTNLEQLYLNDNRIMNINGLENLKKLKFLFLKGNPIPKDLLDKLGGIDSDGRINFPQDFVDYCDDMNNIVELVLEPIPMQDFDEKYGVDDYSSIILSINDIDPKKLIIPYKDEMNSNLSKISKLVNQHRFIDALEMLEKLRESTINNKIYDIADELTIKIQDVKNQRITYHLDNALLTFKNTTMCDIADIREYLSLTCPDVSMSQSKLKLKILSRINSLNIEAALHENILVFKEFAASQQFSETYQNEPYTYSKKECTYCGENIDSEAIICPFCGIDQEQN